MKPVFIAHICYKVSVFDRYCNIFYQVSIIPNCLLPIGITHEEQGHTAVASKNIFLDETFSLGRKFVLRFESHCIFINFIAAAVVSGKYYHST